MKNKKIVFICVAVLIVIGVLYFYKNNITDIKSVNGGGAASLAPSIIYKTKNDYSNNISVNFKDNKIVGFPGPSDAINQRPGILANGYLFKKMTGNVFLSTTFDEFISVGDKGDWFKFINVDNIIDRDPFTEMYSCPRGGDEEYVNKIILAGELNKKCEKIK